jgi:hypothetical protein
MYPCTSASDRGFCEQQQQKIGKIGKKNQRKKKKKQTLTKRQKHHYHHHKQQAYRAL